uniref:glycerol-3-phosphate dehydrogenase n=1 Tax=Trichuris muris TaxID=70415 RepID=A0A5S6Q981_TRIMR
MARHFKRLCSATAIAATGMVGTWLGIDIFYERKLTEKLFMNVAAKEVPVKKNFLHSLPTRAQIINSLKETEEFDLLVIGGGATGAGVVLDAQTRGLKAALVEMDDFSSGTSSRSTKLIHGGVRYLQSAILKFDYEQYRMVKEALFERYHLIQVAPHLSSVLPIMLPIYKWWQVPYYYVGIKAYDFVAGSRRLKSSYYINKERALELFPLLRKESLVGALIYYDGQHNDARMNLSLILTAIRYGAKCANHVEVVNLTYSSDGANRRVAGVIAKDRLTGKEMHIRAKCVVNATGAFCDKIRVMDDPEAPLLVVPSQGVHIILPAYYSPSKSGLLDPSTSDGRVIFFLPWLNMTMAGTTDSPCEITDSPAPAEKDVEFILNEIRHYLVPDVSIRRGDVMSAWAGLRPLVRDPKKSDTASLARNHIIVVSDSKLITIAGGKWTTYRHMAEETVNKAVKVCGLEPTNDCITAGLMLEGGHKYHPLLYIRLVQDYGLDVDVATHLAATYGDKAYTVARMSKLTGQRFPVVGKKLHNEFPYIEAEVLYAVKEYACTAVDFLSRRTRFAFLNTYAAEEALPRVVELMGEELHWNKEEKKRQMASAIEFLQFQMGANARQKAYAEAPLMLTQEERENAVKCFNEVDKDKNGGISVNDLRRYFEERGEKINENELHRLLDEVDLNKNGEIDLCEFLQVYSGLKGGWVCQNPFAHYLGQEMSVLTPERSGGGV